MGKAVLTNKEASGLGATSVLGGTLRRTPSRSLGGTFSNLKDVAQPILLLYLGSAFYGDHPQGRGSDKVVVLDC